MRLRIGPSLGIALGLLGGLFAGVAVSAGATGSAAGPPVSDYEIVRATFTAGGPTAEGSARCSEGKLVMGGGGRVLDEGMRLYAMVASDPAGPSSWSAVFVRHPEGSEGPVIPGRPAPEGEGETEFEVSAVCAAVR
jgi:hypothetical protein